MNKQHFEEWFRKILQKIPTMSVIVIDQAPYHTMLDPELRNPTLAWKEASIIKWVQKRKIPLSVGVEAHEMLTIRDLLNMSKPYWYPKCYLLEKITRKMRGDDVKLLWIPVAHCELNAIELIWAHVKRTVFAENSTFKIKDVLELCIEQDDNDSED
ncbi:uncharacterized protein LOC117180511 [Belonocnema kinseyi]|uniref:uncharacterized protein LOC117180511 n=1 Tax=Belonocnema kinseyi TaxID=2817044 RepID=UPI00143D98F0|nr:uncharacterized protein LOC117180511 [Belonocnema kinseyi]